jgi:uncharacterized protein YciI
MKQTTKAMGRLVDLKTRAVEIAEAAYALACREVAAAEETRLRAEDAWLRAIHEQGIVGVVGDLHDRDSAVRARRQTADAAQKAAAAAKRREAEASIALVAAKIEQRRYETWIERRAEATAAEERRVERIAEDEVSARSSGGKKTGT